MNFFYRLEIKSKDEIPFAIGLGSEGRTDWTREGAGQLKGKQLKIPVSAPLLGEKELEYVINAVKSNWISSKGKYVSEFEEKFSKYCGAKYGIATSSGTTALHLALASLDIGKNDEVIIPAFTMIATANANLHRRQTHFGGSYL